MATDQADTYFPVLLLRFTVDAPNFYLAFMGVSFAKRGIEAPVM